VHRTGGRLLIPCIHLTRRQAIDVAAGVLTGDAVAGMDALLKQSGSRDLENPTDRGRALLRRAPPA